MKRINFIERCSLKVNKAQTSRERSLSLSINRSSTTLETHSLKKILWFNSSSRAMLSHLKIEKMSLFLQKLISKWSALKAGRSRTVSYKSSISSTPRKYLQNQPWAPTQINHRENQAQGKDSRPSRQVSSLLSRMVLLKFTKVWSKNKPERKHHTLAPGKRRAMLVTTKWSSSVIYLRLLTLLACRMGLTIMSSRSKNRFYLHSAKTLLSKLPTRSSNN
jgi:hypothetical protein